MQKKEGQYIEHKNLAYAILRTNFPKSDIYIVNRNLIIIDGQKYTTDHFDSSTIQKAFRILKGNGLYSNL